MRPQTVDARRGLILDRDYKVLAVSIGADAVYALPEVIQMCRGQRGNWLLICLSPKVS